VPTGRPDYWYGTALYFDDSPGDGEVTRGPTCNWAYDHVNDAEAHHTGFVSYVDRGDHPFYDWVESGLTLDANWHDLDLSGIVPVGTIAILMRTNLQAALPGNYIGFKRKGNTNNKTDAWCDVQTANIHIQFDKIVGVDGDRKIEYFGTVNPTSIDLSIIGWWL